MLKYRPTDADMLGAKVNQARLEHLESKHTPEKNESYINLTNTYRKTRVRPLTSLRSCEINSRNLNSSIASIESTFKSRPRRLKPRPGYYPNQTLLAKHGKLCIIPQKSRTYTNSAHKRSEISRGSINSSVVF